MLNSKENILDIVSRINNKFEALSSFSNDELRDLVDKLKLYISSASDKKNALDAILIDVYAIVKETARRFSNGKVIVTANKYDKSLSEKYDFVTMDGTKAIYNNHWDTEGIPFIWNMVHYDEQLIGGIYLHYGNAIEMATGEGKTLVSTLPVFLNSLSHEGVHVMTANEYLSKRDYLLTRPLYLFYGISVDCIENNEKKLHDCKIAYNADITFGSYKSFVFDYLNDHLVTNPNDCLQNYHNFAILDEIDSILIDEAETPHIISGGTSYNNEKLYIEYFPIVKELIDTKNKSLFTYDKIKHNVVLTKNGKNWLAKKINNKELYQISKKYEITNFDSLDDNSKNRILNNINIQNALYQLLRAMLVFEKDVDYIVEYDRIKIIDQNTGRIRDRSRWGHGLHTAIEVKENVTTGSDSESIAVISIKNYFKLYSKISGMSGTIQPVKDELQGIYGIKCFTIPTHLPVIREDHPLRIYKTKKAKDAAILKNIILNVNCGRPTLIGTVSLKRADEIAKILNESGLKYNRLDARYARDEAVTVSKAGINNTITLSTSIAGRGTDIKPSNNALQSGGLSVIGTDLFSSLRADLQLKGRTGRQGNPGSSLFYASLEDDILRYLSDEERDKLNKISENIISDDISTQSVREYFKIAQTKREEISRDNRKQTQEKDDTIAPFRASFYELRNRALSDNSFACSQIDKILTDINKTFKDEAEKHISRAGA